MLNTVASTQVQSDVRPDEASRARARAETRLMQLEYLRGAASFYVFLHHYVRHAMDEFRGLVRFFVFGQAAVMLFFLLSGFVIHYATLGQNPNLTFRAYFVRRFRRVFPIFAIALASAYLSTCWVAREWLDPNLKELGLNLLQVQDRYRDEGLWATPYMKNAPLWSLSYEWWFYMLYFPVQRVLARHPSLQKYLVLAISLAGLATNLVWPNPFSHVATYFVLWWFGVELARSYLSRGRARLADVAFPLGSLILVTLGLALLALGPTASGPVDWYRHPAITFRHFATTLGIIFAGGVWYRAGLPGFERLLKPFAIVAPFSYALYVIHLPWLRAGSHAGIDGAWGLVVVMPTLFAACWLLEVPLQRRINRWLRGAAR